MRTFFLLSLLGLIFFGCENTPEKPKEIILPATLPPAWTLIGEGDLIDVYGLSGAQADITMNKLNNTSPFSNCLFRWAEGKATVSFRVEHNRKPGEEPDKYSKQLEDWLTNGEMKNPKEPAYGKWNYQKVDGLGDMAIWSPEFRALKWVVGNDYYLFLNRNQRDQSDLTAEEEMIVLKKLAQRATQKLPKRPAPKPSPDNQ
jgi:hypothetical protein